MVAADLRGSHASGGCPDFGGPADRADGVGIVDWITAQDWSDGAVGARGLSLEGQAAYATAIVLEAGGGLLTADVSVAEVSYHDVPQLPRSLLRHADGARLLYTGDVLDEPLRVTGGTVEIVAAIDATSTHFVVHLNHLAPDGTATNVTFGYLDAVHRRTFEAAEPVEPGVFETYEVVLSPPEYVVPAGHRLELVIASSDFCGDILLNLVGDCRTFGVISDPSGATVTVREGETRVRLVTAPL